MECPSFTHKEQQNVQHTTKSDKVNLHLDEKDQGDSTHEEEYNDGDFHDTQTTVAPDDKSDIESETEEYEQSQSLLQSVIEKQKERHKALLMKIT